MNEMIVSVEQTNGILNISNYDEIKANVQASMELYKTMVFTEDTLIEAKSTVATLRKLSKCLDDKRKDVKRRYMQPYEEFEDKIKELQQIIAEPIELIAQQTKEYEDKRIEQKKEEIQKVYDDCIEGMQEYLPLSRIYSKTWENKGTSIKKIKEAIETLVDNAKMSVETIKNMHSDAEQKVLDTLNAAGIRAEIDTRAEKIGYKIREAQMQKIPYMLVVGAKEEEENLVSVRSRFAGDEGQKSLDEFVASVTEEIATRARREVVKEEN